MKERGNNFLRFSDRYIGIPVVNFLGSLKHKLPFPDNITRIGMISLGAIGDFIISVGAAVPALMERYPGAEIVIFSSAANSGALKLVPGNARIVVLPLSNVPKAVRTIRALHCDLLIDLCTWPRIGAILSLLSGARFTAGFAVPGQHRHRGFDRFVEHRADRHEAENYAALLNAVGVSSVCRPALAPPAEARDRVTALNLPAYVVCHPWASGVRKTMREWPVENWRDLARAMVARGLRVIFTGGPGDREDSAALLAGLDDGSGRIMDFAGRFSLAETAALLQRAEVVVSVNTGIMHLAAALDAPLVALHGPTNPLRWGPCSPHATVLIPDAPNVAYLNLGFEYPPGVEPCMHLLTVGDVTRAVVRHLDSAPAIPSKT